MQRGLPEKTPAGRLTYRTAGTVSLGRTRRGCGCPTHSRRRLRADEHHAVFTGRIHGMLACVVCTQGRGWSRCREYVRLHFGGVLWAPERPLTLRSHRHPSHAEPFHDRGGDNKGPRSREAVSGDTGKNNLAECPRGCCHCCRRPNEPEGEMIKSWRTFEHATGSGLTKSVNFFAASMH